MRDFAFDCQAKDSCLELRPRRNITRIAHSDFADHQLRQEIAIYEHQL